MPENCLRFEFCQARWLGKIQNEDNIWASQRNLIIIPLSTVSAQTVIGGRGASNIVSLQQGGTCL